MAKATLATNFKDDILASSMNGKRRYKQTTNSDGTVSLEDASTYTQVGSAYGASQVNAQNAAINASADEGKIIDTMSAIQVNTQSNYIAGAKAVKEVIDSLVSNIYVGSDGKLHKVQGGADTVLPFNSFGYPDIPVYLWKYLDDGWCKVVVTIPEGYNTVVVTSPLWTGLHGIVVNSDGTETYAATLYQNIANEQVEYDISNYDKLEAQVSQSGSYVDMILKAK